MTVPPTCSIIGPGRKYDPLLSRFLSADTVVPGAGNPQALNRYAYVLNNPLKYTDPSGHAYDPGEPTGKPENKRPPVPPVTIPSLPGSGSSGNGTSGSTSNSTSRKQSTSDDEIILPWQFWRFDAFGARVNFSGGFVLGGSVNIDMFWNRNTNELSIFATPAGQGGAILGGDITLGFIEIANLPSNKDFREWAVGLGGTGTIDVVGVAAEWSCSTEAGSGGRRPQTWFFGYAVGGEIGAYGDAGYAVELVRITEKSGVTIFPDFRLSFFPDPHAYDPWPW